MPDYVDELMGWWANNGGYRHLMPHFHELLFAMQEERHGAAAVVGIQFDKANVDHLAYEVLKNRDEALARRRELDHRYHGRAWSGIRLDDRRKIQRVLKPDSPYRETWWAGGWSCSPRYWLASEQPRLPLPAPLFIMERMMYGKRNSLAEQEQEAVTAHMEECRRLNQSEAGQKARELLLSHLNEDQREEYLTTGRFHVWVPGPIDRYWEVLNDKAKEALGLKRFGFKRAPSAVIRGRRYCIERGFPNGNVSIVDNQGPIISMCIHPADPYPTDDTLLMQKLMIETDEVRFLNTANYSYNFDTQIPIVVKDMRQVKQALPKRWTRFVARR